LHIMEIRIGVFRYPMWPFRMFLALGLTMMTIQLFINMVKSMSLVFGHPYFAEIKKEEITT
jgi:hypothetical protein